MKRTKNIFDRLGTLIPGYGGYTEREGRRNCDKILREKISSQLHEVEKTLYEKMNESIKRGDREQMKALEEVRKQINTFGAQVKFAPYVRCDRLFFRPPHQRR